MRASKRINRQIELVDRMSTLYEIVELENGDIALQRADAEGSEPLVLIKFSEESLYFLNEAKFDVAKAMIEAGLEAASDIQEEVVEEGHGQEQETPLDNTLH